MEKGIKALKNLDSFITYLEATKPEDWATDVVRTKDGKNCVMGHLVRWFYGDNHEGSISPIWDLFEEMWATTYMIYPVNDGESPKWMNHKYDQPTAKERVIAYLKNLNAGKEKTAGQLWDEDVAKWLRKQRDEKQENQSR